MSNRAGIFKTRLEELEDSADRLEKLVLKELNELELISKPKVIESLEATIQRQLRRLDEIQDEIDGIIATLKAEGLYEPKSYADAKYVYNPKKIQKPKPKPKPERKPRKVYSIESPTPAKLKAKQAKAKAEKLAARAEAAAKKAQEAAQRKAEAQEQRAAEREAKAVQKALKAAEWKLVSAERKLKADTAPKPRTPPESREVQLAKKRKEASMRKLRELDAQIQAERIALERRLEERKARVIEVADAVELGPQKRYTAQKNLENVEQQLRDLPIRKEQREQRLLELIEISDQEIAELLEKDSQLI